MGKTKLVCPICHGTNVQVRAWVDANTNKFICDCDDDEAWCDDCEEEVYLEEVSDDE